MTLFQHIDALLLSLESLEDVRSKEAQRLVFKMLQEVIPESQELTRVRIRGNVMERERDLAQRRLDKVREAVAGYLSKSVGKKKLREAFYQTDPNWVVGE